MDPNGCKFGITATNIFFASEWNSGAVDFITTELKSKETLDAFNKISFCFLIDGAMDQATCARSKVCKTCMMLKRATPAASWQWAEKLSDAFANITSTWDNAGDDVTNDGEIQSVLKFLAWMKDSVPLMGLQVDYFFDRGFSANNLKSKMTRYW